MTTRAQWLNHPIKTFLRAGARLSKGVHNAKPIYILGTGRSGTTILGKILSLHPELGFLNEPKLMWHLASPFDDLIGSYSLGEARYQLHADDANPAIQDRISRLYAFYMWFSRSKRVLDKYPEMLFRTEFLSVLFPAARFVAILRDGWDTVHSVAGYAKNYKMIYKGELHDWWGRNSRKYRLLVDFASQHVPLFKKQAEVLHALDSSPDRAAVEWIVTTCEAHTRQEKHPNNMLLVRYEDLCSNPSETLHNIMQHCQLSVHPDPVAYAQRALKAVGGRQAFPLHPALTEPFRIAMAQAGYPDR